MNTENDPLKVERENSLCTLMLPTKYYEGKHLHLTTMIYVINERIDGWMNLEKILCETLKNKSYQ